MIPLNEQSRRVFPLTADCQLLMIFGIEVPSLKIKVMPGKIFIENVLKGIQPCVDSVLF